MANDPAGGGLAAWLHAHPEVTRVEAFLFDLTGAAKGKWLDRDKALALDAKGLPIPLSVFAQDVWGCDVPAAGLAFGTGDPDGLCFPVAGRLVPMGEGVAQCFVAMRDALPDPRGALERVLARYAARGLTPVVAMELEFYLYRLEDGRPVPPDGMARRSDTLSTSALAAHADLFGAIFAAAAAMGIPADGMISEAGPGQFELNLRHRADALAAADDVLLLRRLVRALAMKAGLGATFMAKPYGAFSGSGMHIHASLLDAQGGLPFAKAGGGASDMLYYAVEGLLAAMPETMLAFAPHANSYRRFRPDAHAPLSASWGLDDRSAAVRVITGEAKATRIEHRISGADVNPYVALTAMLGAMLEGMDAGILPPPPQDPADPGEGRPLPVEWGAAIAAFAGSDRVARIFGERFRDILVACKQQDREAFLSHIDRFEYETYLGVV
ncbi:MAG: Gamma-glutamylputrescine synthetase [Pseudomonadota bacterium]|jgi:glutamine synthetase